MRGLIEMEKMLKYKGKPLIRRGNMVYYGDPQDKYMIAKKELKTIYFLVNLLAIYRDEKIPAKCRGISHIVKQASLGNSKFLDSNGNDFTKHIDNIVAERYECFKSANERLYYKFTDKMIDRLLENKYIIETKDWNRKTGKIKLSGSTISRLPT